MAQKYSAHSTITVAALQRQCSSTITPRHATDPRGSSGGGSNPNPMNVTSTTHKNMVESFRQRHQELRKNHLINKMNREQAKTMESQMRDNANKTFAGLSTNDQRNKMQNDTSEENKLMASLASDEEAGKHSLTFHMNLWDEL